MTLDKSNIAGIASLVIVALTGIGELIRFVGPLFGFAMGASEAEAIDKLAVFTFGLAVGSAGQATQAAQQLAARVMAAQKGQ